MVVVPGTEGNFGVLPGHALFISSVRPGVIAVYRGEQVSERIFVSGGFAEVTPERCTVLADEAAPLSSLDRGRIEENLKSAAAEAAGLKDRLTRLQGVERDQAMAALNLAETRQAVAVAQLAALQEGATQP